ncbi:MAG: hypothetical protein NTZ59_02445 [Bacteroidetes bacterium]|nr:hypothetical protein [Bacteroidota bacterium]
MQPNQETEYKHRNTIGKIAQIHKVKVCVLWSWIFIDAAFDAELKKFLEPYTYKAAKELPPKYVDAIYNIIHTQNN